MSYTNGDDPALDAEIEELKRGESKLPTHVFYVVMITEYHWADGTIRAATASILGGPYDTIAEAANEAASLPWSYVIAHDRSKP